MPFRSKAQEGWMFANKPEMAKEWASHTPKGAKLPERVRKRRKGIGGTEIGMERK